VFGQVKALAGYAAVKATSAPHRTRTTAAPTVRTSPAPTATSPKIALLDAAEFRDNHDPFSHLQRDHLAQ
jgi:hypothetical protein